MLNRKNISISFLLILILLILNLNCLEHKEDDSWKNNILNACNNEWAGTIRENDDYYFTVSSEGILQIDKGNNKKKVIYNTGKQWNQYRLFMVTDKEVYFSDYKYLYSYNINKKNTTNLFDIRDLLLLGPYGDPLLYPDLCGAQLYNDKIYLLVATDIYEFDIDKFEANLIAYDARSNVFADNKLLYLQRSADEIKEYDLKKGTTKVVRRCKNENGFGLLYKNGSLVYYNEITKDSDKLYMMKDTPEKDLLIYEFKNVFFAQTYAKDELYFVVSDSDGNNSLYKIENENCKKCDIDSFSSIHDSLYYVTIIDNVMYYKTISEESDLNLHVINGIDSYFE